MAMAASPGLRVAVATATLPSPASTSSSTASCSMAMVTPQKYGGRGCVSFTSSHGQLAGSGTQYGHSGGRRAVAVKAALASGEGMEMTSEMVKPVNWRGQEEREEKVGVLLLNLGGPESLEDVQPFLYNLFADPVPVRSCPRGELKSINLVTGRLDIREER